MFYGWPFYVHNFNSSGFRHNIAIIFVHIFIHDILFLIFYDWIETLQLLGTRDEQPPVMSPIVMVISSNQHWTKYTSSCVHSSVTSPLLFLFWAATDGTINAIVSRKLFHIPIDFRCATLDTWPPLTCGDLSWVRLEEQMFGSYTLRDTIWTIREKTQKRPHTGSRYASLGKRTIKQWER